MAGCVRSVCGASIPEVFTVEALLKRWGKTAGVKEESSEERKGIPYSVCVTLA